MHIFKVNKNQFLNRRISCNINFEVRFSDKMHSRKRARWFFAEVFCHNKSKNLQRISFGKKFFPLSALILALNGLKKSFFVSSNQKSVGNSFARELDNSWAMSPFWL